MEREIAAYNLQPPIVSSNFDLISYWSDAAEARRDGNGNVVEGPRFPVLSALSRVYHNSVDSSTSCESERDFSALATTMSSLRRSMDPDRVEKMMFLHLNSEYISEVREVKTLLSQIKTKQAKGQLEAATAQAAGAGEMTDVVSIDD